MQLFCETKNLPREYKFLMLLGMFYAVILCVCGLYTYRPLLLFHGITFSASDLIYPFSYVVSDIIAEIYGYTNARKLIWFGLLSCFLFAFITSVTNHFPYPPAYKGKADAYVVVFGPYIRLTFAGLFSMTIGEFLNAIAITRWKILLRGRWFWLRSIGSTAIGSFLDTLIAYVVAFYGLVSLPMFIKWFLFAYFFRLLYAGIMGGPASIAVFLLKKAEGTTADEEANINYNPFLLRN